MPNQPTPRGITPPAPGLEREEPTFVPEEDIPAEDTRATAHDRDERSPRGPERE
jgi:hypothetical protein